LSVPADVPPAYLVGPVEEAPGGEQGLGHEGQGQVPPPRIHHPLLPTALYLTENMSSRGISEENIYWNKYEKMREKRGECDRKRRKEER
jgi:hypothetical protein